MPLYTIPTTFPFLLDFMLFVPLLLRLVLGITLVSFGQKNVHEHESGYIKALSALEILAGFCLILGAFVQIIGIISIVLLLIHIHFQKNLPREKQSPRLVFVLLITIALTLIVSGAGLFGLDLPL